MSRSEQNPGWRQIIQSGFDAGTLRISLGGECTPIPSQIWGPQPAGVKARDKLYFEVLNGVTSLEGANLLSRELDWKGESQPPMTDKEFEFLTTIGETGLKLAQASMAIYGWTTPFTRWDVLPPPTISNLMELNPVKYSPCDNE